MPDTVPVAAAPAVEARRFTAEEYHRMAEAGILTEDDRTELWLVALGEEYVEVYRQPAPDGYGRIVRHERGQPLDIQALDEGILTVDDVLE